MVQRHQGLHAAPAQGLDHLAIVVEGVPVPLALARLDPAPFDREAVRVVAPAPGKLEILLEQLVVTAGLAGRERQLARLLERPTNHSPGCRPRPDERRSPHPKGSPAERARISGLASAHPSVWPARHDSGCARPTPTARASLAEAARDRAERCRPRTEWGPVLSAADRRRQPATGRTTKRGSTSAAVPGRITDL